MVTFPTEFSFTLPRGYIDSTGQVQRMGRMRLALALDEIEALQDPRVQANQAYLPVLLLSRVIAQLGDLPVVTPAVIAGLFAIDLAYLEDLYQRINSPDPVLMGAVCPYCSGQFQLQVSPLGTM
ncbi:MAG: phage tail assembly protein [Chloroflexi bacterium]|nr:phage tail assembly protein [Chloroflexota bacterium]